MALVNPFGELALEETLQQVRTAAQAVQTQITELNAKSPDTRTDFIAGRIRTAGGQQAVAANTTGCFHLGNPTGSGKVLTVVDFILATDMVGNATFWFDSTITTPTNVAAFNPNRAYDGAGLTTVGVSQRGTGRTGGSQISPVYLLPNSIPVHQDFPLVLLPGMSVLVAVTSPALSALNFFVTCTWAEDPA